MSEGRLYRLTAFSEDPAGGNPAGVWVGEALPEAAAMQRIAAEVGFSETAFVTPTQGRDRVLRYYSPEAEVSFCGHATVASGVLLGREEGEGRYRFSTAIGDVAVDVRRDGDRWTAALTSVPPRYEPAERGLLDTALRLLGWSTADLDAEIPPARAWAGAWHLVLATAERSRLDNLEYDFEALKALMIEQDLTTLQLVWRESAAVFHARNPFPVGGVVEDPATGAAAAALGGYLREAGLLAPPATFRVRQGEAMGRPSLLTVEVPETGGILVSGSAVDL